jgi:hypothetical protein
LKRNYIRVYANKNGRIFEVVSVRVVITKNNLHFPKSNLTVDTLETRIIPRQYRIIFLL